jgi:hypothetical protein
VSSNDVDVTARYEIDYGFKMYREVSGIVLIKLLNSRAVSPTVRVTKVSG